MAKYGQAPTMQDNNATEKSIKSCYAVIYVLKNRKWIVSGEGGWSECHLCLDTLDSTHRMVAWTVKTSEVLMNCNVTAECSYKEKSKNFHSFTDENGDRYGLGFHKSESGLVQAQQFLAGVIKIIKYCKLQNIPSSPKMELSQSNSVVPPMGYQRSLDTNNHGILKNSIKEEEKNENKINPNWHNDENGGYYDDDGLYYDEKGKLTGYYDDDGEYYEYTKEQLKQIELKNKKEKVPPPPPPSAYSNSNNSNSPKLALSQSQTSDCIENYTNNTNNMNTLNLDEMEYDYKQKRSVVTPNPNYHLSKNTLKALPTVPVGTSLKILPAKPGKLLGGDKKIKNPNKVILNMSVKHNKETGVYEGLPKEWLKELNKQFGVNPKDLPGVKIHGYNSKIPKVLVTLSNSIMAKNGFHQVGIFRLAPNASDNDKMKDHINTNGKLITNHNDDTDVNLYANLIKVWFRDLPQPILNCVDPTRVELVNNKVDAQKVIQLMPEPQQSIFLWLSDMCVECSKYQKINKMNPQNLAIVISPNLFNTNNFENPMKAMTFSAKVVEFFKHSINLRIDFAKGKGNYELYDE